MDRPTGIIRTLPTIYGDGTDAKAKFERTLELIESGHLGSFMVLLSARPKHTVLHLYILVEGKVRVRVNIAEIIDGRDAGEIKCWDNTVRRASWLAVCTAPIVRPPREIKMRGFQGFRYTEGLF